MANNYFVVRSDLTPDDNYRDEDTLSGIAAEWLKLNPQQTEFRATAKKSKLELVEEWISEHNHLKNGRGVECGKNVTGAIIHPGERLELPAGNGITNPKQHRVACPVILPPPAPEVPTTTLTPPPPPPPAPPPPLPPEDMGARLMVYAPPVNLAGGRTSDAQNIADMLPLLREVPQQPHTAARGSSSYNPLGIQTFADLGARILRVAPFIPVPLGNPLTAPLAATFIGADKDTRGRPLGHEREGSDATNQDSANKPFRLDISPITGGGFLGASGKTRRDSTLLWGVGVTHDKDGNVIDLPEASRAGRLNQNEFTTTPGEGENILSVTSNRRAQSTGGRKQNGYLGGKPSAPVGIPLGNYEIASYIDTHYAAGELDKAMDAASASPTAENLQRAIALTNLRANLTGMTNYPANADVSKPLDDKAMLALNPREALLYNRARLLDTAKAKGVTVNPDEIAVPQSITRAEMREQMITYYTETAKVKPNSFPEVYKEVTGSDIPSYDKNNEAQRRAIATTFVDKLPYLQTYPENGFSMEKLKKYYLSPRSEFSTVENFTYTSATPPRDASVLAAGMDALASSPDNVRAILAAAGTNPQIAASFAERDKGSIAAPKWFDNHKGGFNRNDEVADVAARGYSADVMSTDFSKNAARDTVIRNMPGIQANLAASASSDAIVALRQRDLRQMPTDGKAGKPIAPGATANNLLNILAQDSALLATFDDNIRKEVAKNGGTPADADKKIEALHQAVLYAKDHVTSRFTGFGTTTGLGPNHTDIAAYAYAGSSTGRGGATQPVDVLNGYFSNPKTNATALTAIEEKQPALMSAAILQTLRTHPELQQQVLGDLKSMGRDGGLFTLFAKSGEHSLADLTADLLKAERNNDTARVAELTTKFNNFVSNPANANAVSDLFVATVSNKVNGVDSRQALTTTLTTSIAAAARGDVVALPGYSVGGDQYLSSVYTAVTTFDPARSAQLAAEGARTMDQRFTTTGMSIPFIITPNPYKQAPKPKDQPQPPQPPTPQPTPTPTPPTPLPNGPVPTPPPPLCNGCTPPLPTPVPTPTPVPVPTPVGPVPTPPPPLCNGCTPPLPTPVPTPVPQVPVPVPTPVPVPVPPTPVPVPVPPTPVPVPVPVPPTPVPVPVPVPPTPVPVPVPPTPVPVPVPVPTPVPVPVPVPTPVPVPVPTPVPPVPLPPPVPVPVPVPPVPVPVPLPPTPVPVPPVPVPPGIVPVPPPYGCDGCLASVDLQSLKAVTQTTGTATGGAVPNLAGKGPIGKA